MALAWLQFGVCLAVIWLAGVRLSRYGDVIAEKTGMGRTWIGLVLLATVTSLPELVSGISSVTLAGTPDIAVGNVLGACIFNVTMIAVLDFSQRGESVFSRASQGHILAAGFGIILIGQVGFALSLQREGLLPAIGHVGVTSPIVLAVYAVAIYTVFRYERRQRAQYVEAVAERYPDVTLRAAVTRFAAAAAVITLGGTALPFVGERLADVMGWQQTFVGTMFVAFATTVPELSVTLTAARMGAVDLAIGNLFGSNLFNVAILAIDDLCFLPGPLLAHVSPVHVVSSLSAVMMTGIAIVGLLYRPVPRLPRAVGSASLLLLMLYLLNTYALYLFME